MITLIKNLYHARNIFLRHKKELFLFLIIDFICILLLVVSPALVSQILIHIMNQQYQEIIIYILLLIFDKALFLLFSVLSTKCYLLFRKKVTIDMKTYVSECIMNMQIDEIYHSRKGKFLNRIMRDLDDIPTNLSYIRDYLKILFTNLLTIFYIIYLNYIIGIIYLISLIIMIFLKSIGVKYKNYYMRKSLLENEKTSSDISEAYNGIQDIKQLNLTSYLNDRITKHFTKSEHYQYKGDLLNNIFYILSRTVEWSCTGIVIMLGIYLIESKQLLLDTFITIFMYRNIIFTVDACLSDLILKISLLNLSWERIFELTSFDTKKSSLYKKKIQIIDKIEFCNVFFTYQKRWVLKNCSFTLQDHHIYAIVGASGSGKSTILNLMTGLYQTTRGEILFNDISITDYDVETIQQNISIVSQNYYLFDMSIKENLLLAKPSATDDEIIQICKKVGIHQDIQKLENKYDTIIGEGAKFLSGGQKQRIAIARMLLMNHKILLFDEATASLDAQLEEQIFKLIYQLRKNHIIVFISHNMHLIEKIDNIMVLDKGHIVARGSHEQLCKESKLYQSFIHKSKK